MADLFSSAEFTLLHDYMLVDANQKKQMEYYVRYAQNQWRTSFLDEGETLDIHCEHFHAVFRYKDINMIYADVIFA